MLFSSLGWGPTANPVQFWFGLHRYKPCSGLGESKFPCASMGEIVQADVFAGEVPSQLHTHCPSPLLPFLTPWLLCVLSELLAVPGQQWGLAPCHLILGLLLPGFEGCLSLCPISTQSPSPCSTHSFTHNLGPLLGPGRLHRAPPAAASPTPLPVLPFLPGFLLASQSVLAVTQRTSCDPWTPTTASCHLKHQPLAHRQPPWWRPLGSGALCRGDAGHGYGGRRSGFRCRASWY